MNNRRAELEREAFVAFENTHGVFNSMDLWRREPSAIAEMRRVFQLAYVEGYAKRNLEALEQKANARREINQRVMEVAVAIGNGESKEKLGMLLANVMSEIDE